MAKKDDYKISMAEFKGRTLAHLEVITKDISSINGEIKEVKSNLSTKACKKDVQALTTRIDNMGLVSGVVGGIGGILSGVAAVFGLKSLRS